MKPARLSAVPASAQGTPHAQSAQHSQRARWGAPLLFIGSGFSQYIGAGIAVALFFLVSPFAVAWLRVLLAGIVLALWRRPWRLGLTSREVAASAFFGIVMATMNLLFYAAIGMIPIGTVVSLEFCGPVLVAIFTGRGWRPRLAALLAATGVTAIGGLGIDLSEPRQLLGALFALAAGATWAGYILLGQRIAAQRSGIDSLALGALAGGIVYLPFGVAELMRSAGWQILTGQSVSAVTAATTSEKNLFAWLTGGTHVPANFTVGQGQPLFTVQTSALVLIIAIIAVALLSTVLPYSLEQIAFAQLSAAGFALLSSLLPLTSTLIGALMLAQLPNFGQWTGLICISLAVALARWQGSLVPRRQKSHSE